jgi:hypothetical protein
MIKKIKKHFESHIFADFIKQNFNVVN